METEKNTKTKTDEERVENKKTKTQERTDNIVEKVVDNIVGGERPVPIIDDPEIPTEDFSELKIRVYSLLLQRERASATEIITDYIIKHNYIYTTRDDKNPECWIYHKGIYIPQGKTYIKETCRKLLGESYTPHIGNAVIAKIEADTYIEPEEFFKNENVEEIPVENGILNIFTKELTEFTPDKIFFNKLPLTYDKKARCPNIIKHFETILKHSEDLPVIQELFGFLLLKDYRFEKAFMFNGGGRNGKGKTLSLMKRFLGVDNCTSISLKSIERDSLGDVADLFGKMANIAGDFGPSALKDTGKFKELTGRDLITAPRKFLNPIKFTNYAKFIFSCNELPQTKDLTTAFWNRWIYLEFPYTFLTKKEIDSLPEEEQENKKVIDTNIIKTLTTEAEINGLLIWALEGFDRLIEKEDFSYSKTTKEVERIWMIKSASFTAFIQENIIEDFDESIPKQELKKKYLEFCRENRIKPTNDKEIKDTLYSTFPISEEVSNEGFSGKKVRKWGCISWNPECKNDKEDREDRGNQVYRKNENPYQLQTPCPPCPTTKIELITDLPKHTQIDLKEYGSWKIGDIVDVPEAIADILIKTGKAEKK